MTSRRTRRPGVRPSATVAFAAAAIVIALAAGCDDPGAGGRAAPEPAPPAAERPARGSDVLDRIVRAETTLAYHGLRSIVQGPRGASRETRLRVVRTAAGRTLLEWTGDGSASRRHWSADHRFPWIARPKLLLANYDVTVDPEPAPPVAWRETRRVRISGLRTGRPSMELLVDAETWIVLAETIRDGAGAECRSARFESFDLGEGEPAGDAPVSEALPADVEAGGRPPEGLVVHPVVTLPDGFERIGGGRSACGAWRDDFSDGLATFSVLQRPASADAPEGEVRRRVWLGGSQLVTRIGATEVTIAGTLGPSDLLPVLGGLRAP